MAKQSEAAPATSSTPAPSAGESTAAAPRFMGANKVDATVAEVVKWNNGEVSATEVPIVDGVAAKPEEEAPADKPAEAPKTEEKPVAPAEGDKPAEEKPVTAKPTADPERRKQIIEALAAERAKQSMAKQIEDVKKAAEAATKAQEEFDKLPLGRKLAIIAQKHGMSVDDLKDRLLIGADDVTEPAARPPDPEVLTLKETVSQLQERLKKQDEQTAQAQYDRAIGQVRASLKEIDLPLVDTFDAYGRVLSTAHEAWMASGKAGAVADFLPDAATIVEDELKAEKPNVAARLYPKVTTEEAETEEPAKAEAPKPRIAAGKRTASRPEAKPKSLWEGGKSAAEVDAIIKKELGWG